MFETCMVESAGQLKSTNTKWTTAGAFALEGTLLALVVIATMVRPEMLPATAGIIHLTPPYAPPRATQVIATERHSAMARADAMTIPMNFPAHARTVVDPKEDFGPPLPPGVDVGPRNQNPIIDMVAASANPPAVHPAVPTRVIVSTMDPARLIRQVNPVYPPIAKIARIQGIVELHAIIGRDGSIENLQVVSGPPSLVEAAQNAVRQWRYKPTYLGGQPVEVETTITVRFTLSGQ
jgi:protein TonB